MPVDTMRTLINRLIEIHDALNDIAKEKTEAIKNGDVHTVSRLTSREVPLIKELEELNKKRESTAAEDVRALGGQERKPTFREWQRLAVPEESRPEWETLSLKLINRIHGLRQTNRLNQDMLRQSLQWIRLSMNLLQPPVEPANYGHRKTGKDPLPPFSGRIDSRA
ncbi:flagellar protein FlgN [Sporolactobacillus sp. THM7-7]|nr:flagellar protein FlgN [Sporolactobacillus sp. THM7-7]